MRMHFKKNKYIDKWSWNALKLKRMSAAKVWCGCRKCSSNGIIFWERVCLRFEKRQWLTCNDKRLISLKREVGAHKTSFSQPFFYWNDCRGPEKWAVMYMYVRGLATIVRLCFGIVRNFFFSFYALSWNRFGLPR